MPTYYVTSGNHGLDYREWPISFADLPEWLREVIEADAAEAELAALISPRRASADRQHAVDPAAGAPAPHDGQRSPATLAAGFAALTAALTSVKKSIGEA